MKPTIAYAALLVTFLVGVPAFAQSRFPLTEWTVPTANSQPTSIAINPEGFVWFVESRAKKIARLDPSTNTVTEWPVPFPAFGLGSEFSKTFFAADGQVFFNSCCSFGAIFRFNPLSGELRWWPYSRNDPNSIAFDASDPDNPLVWIFGVLPPLARLDPAKNEAEEFDSRGFLTRIEGEVEVDSDGVLWVAGQAALARLDPNSKSLTRYGTRCLDPGCMFPVGPDTFGIKIDDDGQIFVTEPQANKIGRVDPMASTITEYSVPTPNASPSRIDIGPSIYFTEPAVSKLGRLDPSEEEGKATDLVATTREVSSPFARPRAPTAVAVTGVDNVVTPTQTSVTSTVAGGFEEFNVASSLTDIAVAGCSVFFAERSDFLSEQGNKIGLLQTSPEKPMKKLREKVARLKKAKSPHKAETESLEAKLDEAEYFFSIQNAGGAGVVLQSLIDEVGQLLQAGSVPAKEARFIKKDALMVKNFCR